MTMQIPPNGSVIYFIVHVYIKSIFKKLYYIDIDLSQTIYIARTTIIPTHHGQSTIIYSSFISFIINVKLIQLLTS